MKRSSMKKISLAVVTVYFTLSLAACGTAISGSGSGDDCCDTEIEDCCNTGSDDDCCEDGNNIILLT